MLSKMSFLNKSIIKSDIKRFWWLSVLNMLITFFSGTFFVMNDYIFGYRYDYSIRFTSLPHTYYFAMAFGMGFALLTTVAVFSYLNKSEQVAFAHAFPLTRGKQYASHLTSAFILCGASGVINALIIWIYTFNDVVAKYLAPIVAIKFLAVYLTYSVLIISLTAFMQMITASSVACSILTVCVAAIPIALEGFFKAFCEVHVYGYETDYNYLVAKVFYLSMEKILSVRFLIYLALILVFLASGYFLYKKRRLECFGEVCAFTETRPLFIYTVAVFAGMASYLYFGNFYEPNIFFMLPFGIIGVVASYMLSRKSFSLRGIHKPVIIYTLFVVALFAVVKFDITGYERRIPDAADVEYIELPGRTDYEVTGFYPDDKKGISDIYFFRYDEPFDGRITDFAEIENVINLHSYLIDNRNDEGRFLRINYKLKNGKVLKRRYRVDVYNDAEHLKPIYNSEKYRGMMYEIANGQPWEISEVWLYDDRVGEIHGHTGEAEIKKITEAFIKDVKETPYEKMEGILEHENVKPTSIHFTCKIKGKYDSDKFKDTVATKTLVYRISPNFVNTIAALSELGCYDAIPDYTEVEEIGVNIHKYSYEDGMGVVPESSARIHSTTLNLGDVEFMYRIDFYDKEGIKEVYDLLYTDMVSYPGEMANYTADIYIIMKNGRGVNFSLNTSEKYWPSAIKKFIE